MTLRSLAEQEAIHPLESVPAEPRSHADGRPWLFTNMVASLDGAAAVDGLSGALGDADDRQMFRALRASADAILVGAGTANAEGYRPPPLSPEVSASRSKHRRSPRPLIAVVSASLSVDPALELFSDPDYRPIIFTSDQANQDHRSALEDRADIISLGSNAVDLPLALDHLGSAGHRTVLSEGGPTLNGHLISHDLIDEWNLTLSPVLVGGGAPRTAHGTTSHNNPAGPSTSLPDYELARLWQGDRALFSRWVKPTADNDSINHPA